MQYAVRYTELTENPPAVVALAVGRERAQPPDY